MVMQAGSCTHYQANAFSNVHARTYDTEKCTCTTHTHTQSLISDCRGGATPSSFVSWTEEKWDERWMETEQQHVATKHKALWWFAVSAHERIVPRGQCRWKECIIYLDCTMSEGEISVFYLGGWTSSCLFSSTALYCRPFCRCLVCH